MTAPTPSAKLYTPDILTLAIALADFPFDPVMPCSGEARSRTCGSTLALSCAVDAHGKIEALGMNVSACAIGQAAAAIFARGATGHDIVALTDVATEIGQWLARRGARPEWPGLGLLDAAAAYPARHGAILLPWNAAIAALGKAETAS